MSPRYLLYRGAAAALPHVPPAVGYRLFAALGDLAFLTARRWRALVQDNLRAVTHAGTDVSRLARQAFRNLLWNYYEMFSSPGRTRSDLRARGVVEGIERLEAIAEGDTGAIIVFAHTGNLEIMAQAATLFPHLRFVLVVEHMDDERVYRLIRRLRTRRGLQTVPADQPRRLVQLLHEGCQVIISGDLDSTGTGSVVEFFGRPARMPHGAVKLALRSGAPLLPVVGWRESMDQPARYRIRVSPPLHLKGSGYSTEDVTAGVQRLARVMERTIATQPEQWLAFRQIWEDENR